MITRSIRVYWLGLRSYGSVHELQQQALVARQQGLMGDIVLLLEHRPVITLGRSAKNEHVLVSQEALASRGIDLVTTARGGDVTYHGPGQLVAYPIVSLEPDRCDVRRYVRDLLETMAGLANEHGVSAGIIDEYPGIWVDTANPRHWPGQNHAVRPAKLGAVGVRISRWVTMHGFAFNASTDRSGFAAIIPCGIRQYDVTTLDELVGGKPQPQALAPRAAQLFCERFGADLESYSHVDADDAKMADAIGIPATC